MEFTLNLSTQVKGKKNRSSLKGNAIQRLAFYMWIIMVVIMEASGVKFPE